ncbi:MAG: hypothetical protein DRJ07_19425, partial [Bacteroidetes bacterium]
MKKTAIYLIFLLLVQTNIFGQKVSLYDELSPLYPDTEINKPTSHMELHTAKGGILSVNLLINNLDKKDILDIKNNLSGFFTKVETYRLIDVPLEENTGLDSRTEQYTGKKNPYVTRRAPFDVYEVLQEVSFPIFTENKTEAFNIKWEVPHNISEGIYNSTVLVKGQGFSKTLHIKTVVHKTTIPKAGYNTFKYTNWFSLKNIAQRHGLKIWSLEFWEMTEKYALKMAEGRQNVFWVTLPDMFDFVNGTPVLQTKRLKKLIQTFTDAGIYYIEFAPIAHRTKNDWSSKTLSSNFNPDMLVNSNEGYLLYDEIFSQLKKIMDENGWNGRSMFHIADEPTDEVVDDYKLFVKHLKKYFPNASILEATMTLGLSGAVDNWCPQIQEYQKHKDFFETRKKEGDKV